MNDYLQFRGLTKRYGSNTALSSIDLTIERGQIVALLGPNGAGKSTLFGCLLGFTLPDRGEILVRGEPLEARHRLEFGYAAERIALYPHRTLLENAVFFAGLKGLPKSEASRQLGRVGLQAVAERKVRQLSKGMLQRLGLAIALCGQPQLLVLDEPFNGLDPVLLKTLQGILAQENARGATLLISTHTMSALEPLATHVAVLLRGSLVARATVAELRNEHAEDASLETIYHEVAVRNRAPEEVFS